MSDAGTVIKRTYLLKQNQIILIMHKCKCAPLRKFDLKINYLRG
jgi:hypothetical protein